MVAGSRILPIFLAMCSITPGCSSGEPRGSKCGPAKARVTEVTDGDTFWVEGPLEIRLRMVDAPESKSNPQECFGQEAADFLANLLAGKEVGLTYDDSKCLDKYGRTLAFVEVEGTTVNRLMVLEGYACAYPYDEKDIPYQVEFKDLESTAKAQGKGMWDKANCQESECVHPLVK